ncbi:uncharacterized protein LOC120353629 [Nilaparvata lugens]|uniref:uncharacterized protein LOC120353629 n=1 Tax=Nilaparvata lugens TaxID=108931 RepID=UPI00193E2CD9|nr:uncharacterized protein LOC120353629 [Nilaparvata lugens]
MTKRTGKSGDSLIIGSYLPPLHDGYLTREYYECDLANREDKYKKEYEPEIFKRTSDSYEMTGAEEKQPQVLSENFIRIKMEIWTCFKKEHMRTHTLIYFIRNEFISFKEIRDIKYVSGVEVSLIDYSSDERRVKVVETKFFYRKDHTLTSNTFAKASALNFKLHLKVHDRQRTYPKPGLAFEVKYPNEGNSLIHDIESSGPYLRLGPSATPNTGDITAQCEPLQGMNPALRRPEVFKVFESSNQKSAPNEDQSIYARLSDKEFDDLFIITKRKFWKCTPTTTTSNGKTSTSEHNSFHRVMHEVVGRKPIKKVISGFGNQEIVSVQMPDQQAKTVLFTIVDNFYMHDLSRITNPVTPTFKEEERLTAIIKSSSDAKEIM